MSALDKVKELLRLPVMFRNASAIASDPDRFVRAMHDNPFTEGEKVKHSFFGWVGKVDRVAPYHGMAGAYVVWDRRSTYVELGDVYGTPIWYAAMALTKVAR